MKTTRFSLFLLLFGAAQVAIDESAGTSLPSIPGSIINNAPQEYREVKGILDRKCVSCHSGPTAARGLELDSWQHILNGSDHGEAVILGIKNAITFSNKNNLLSKRKFQLINNLSFSLLLMQYLKAKSKELLSKPKNKLHYLFC